MVLRLHSSCPKRANCKAIRKGRIPSTKTEASVAQPQRWSAICYQRSSGICLPRRQFLGALTSRSRRMASTIRRRRRTPPRQCCETAACSRPLSARTQLWSMPHFLARPAVTAGRSASKSRIVQPIWPTLPDDFPALSCRRGDPAGVADRDQADDALFSANGYS